MKTLKAPLLVCLLASSALVVNLFAGCGSEENAAIVDVDASPDGTADGPGSGGGDGGGVEGQDAGLGDGSLEDAPTSRADAADCKPTGSCTSSSECCSADCDGPVGAMACVPIDDPNPTGDGGSSGGDSGTPRPDGGGTTGPGGCRGPGVTCTFNTDCCSTSCVGGKCSAKQCVSDNGSCGVDGDCCGGDCVLGKCKPLSTACLSKGNSCTTGPNNRCCSTNCKAGLCVDGSFCRQPGDACTTDGQCCGSNCQKAAGAQLGSCGTPIKPPGVPDCDVKGMVCSRTGTTDPCEGNCCSRVCAPNGSGGGGQICQPPSGCQPSGEVCKTDRDCCGFGSMDKPPTCSKTAPTDQFGRCDNGGSCDEPGSVCKGGSGPVCGTENSCCPPPGENQSFCSSNPENCCKRDRLGIARCLLRAVTCTAAGVAAGTTCATSADCCGQPCVGGKCLGKGQCVDRGGKCTTGADCCTGLPCVSPTGSAEGLCGGVFLSDGGVAPPPATPDAGTTGGVKDAGTTGTPGTCALYGQSCGSGGAGCCNNVPCINNVCIFN